MSDTIIKEGSATTLKKSFKIYLFIIVGLIVSIIVLIFILTHTNSPTPTPKNICGDGSIYNTCSLDKPYYCDNGTLLENATECGCPSGWSVSGNQCMSQYQTQAKNMIFDYVSDGENNSINYTVYGGMSSYLSTLSESIYYPKGQTPKRSDFALKQINNLDQYYFLEPLVKEIENLAPTSKLDQARIAISIVQNIPWGSSNLKINLGGTLIDYSRYPYQVLYDDEGLCGEKSELLSFILRDLGYGVALFYYPSQNHEAVGIKCPLSDSLNNTGYCFVETSGPAIISDSHLTYAGGITLNSTPQLIVLSDGISLPDNIPEYKDAKTLDALNQRFFLDPISSSILKNLREKYGLPKVYNLS